MLIKLGLKSQKGLTLIEMMVGIVVGMLVVAAATAFYITSIRSSADTMRMTKLTNEARTIMSLMVSDLRRAGYWSESAPGEPGEPIEENPFAVRDVGTANHTDLSIYNNGECILYSYDATYRPGPAGNPKTPGVVHTVDIMGYALDGTDLRIHNGTLTDTSACDTNNWQRANDPSTVAITSLQFFTDGSRCRNASTGDSWEIPVDSDETIPACECTDVAICPGYVAPTTGDLLVELRQIRILMEAEHLSDPDTSVTLEDQVKIRNNRLFYAP